LKRRSSWVLFVVGLMAAASLLAGYQWRTLQADAPHNPDLGLPAGEFVARVYYDQISDIDQLQAYDLHEYNNLAEKYVLVGLNRYGYEQLLSQGWRLTVDAEATAALTPDFDLFTYYGGYRNVDELQADMATIVSSYPEIAEIVVYGESYCLLTGGCVTLGGQLQPGYELKALRITNRAIADPDKPVFFLMAALHSREIATPEIAMRLADWLVDGYGVNADATWLVDYHELWIVPVANPDGLWLVELGTKPPYNGNPFTQRKNANRANGCTTWPPTGSSQYGIDLNRNHSFAWGGQGTSTFPCNLTYRGPSVASEVEVYQIENLVRAIIPDQRGPGISDPAPLDTRGIFISLHSYSNLILWPWGHTSTLAPNYLGLKAIGDKMATYNGYVSCQPPACLYAASGTSDDWAYGELGVPAYTYEIGTLAQGGFFPPYARIDDTFWPGNGPALQYAARIARTPYMTVWGPDALNVTAVNNGSNQVTISATINDTANGNQPIVAAEYALNYPFWITDTITGSLTAVDGSFNSPIEPVTAVADLSQLSPGQNILFVRGLDSGGNWGPVTAAFFTVLTPTAGIDVYPHSLAVTLNPGESSEEILTISSIGQLPLEWSVYDLPGYITPAAINGVIEPGEAMTVSLTFTAPMITSSAVYGGLLTVASNDPDQPEIPVWTTMTVTVPTLDLWPVSLSVTLFSGDSFETGLQLSNVGTADLVWSLADLPEWITAVPLSGTMTAGEAITLAVTFNAPAVIASQQFAGTLTISSNDPAQPVALMPVTMVVDPHRLLIPLILR
jgi:carboxypeptidase T